LLIRKLVMRARIACWNLVVVPFTGPAIVNVAWGVLG
jgi:hypothetical protein